MFRQRINHDDILLISDRNSTDIRHVLLNSVSHVTFSHIKSKQRQFVTGRKPAVSQPHQCDNKLSEITSSVPKTEAGDISSLAMK